MKHFKFHSDKFLSDFSKYGLKKNKVGTGSGGVRFLWTPVLIRHGGAGAASGTGLKARGRGCRVPEAAVSGISYANEMAKVS